MRSKGQRLRWAHQLDLRAQRIVDDTGIVQSDFAASGLSMRIEDVMRPGSDAHVRHVVVSNTSPVALEDAEIAFYAFYMLKDLPTGDRIRFDASRGALVQVDGDVAVATVGDRPPVAQHCGHALALLGSQKDARGAAENGKLAGCPDAIDAGIAGVNGVLVHALGALAGGFDARAAEDRAHWKGVLARAEVPAALPASTLPVYRRALVTMLQHRVSNGAFIAAPTLTTSPTAASP